MLGSMSPNRTPSAPGCECASSAHSESQSSAKARLVSSELWRCHRDVRTVARGVGSDAYTLVPFQAGHRAKHQMTGICKRAGA